eukprot:CAMPEP_0206136914 /NCGR_PEP_ID=MMETSP1473-20131121/2123_1 /ASSEMBLY_ACC=CAM_ASM_001109 /TAXON_ID=1461547 /ORGANISM="Stichococcus sp, Strain RCC1054" /LENGTH=38 /DNA_ID= /DNA_START= /DNA_END= /DNA_ORIENTATION=
MTTLWPRIIADDDIAQASNDKAAISHLPLLAGAAGGRC